MARISNVSPDPSTIALPLDLTYWADTKVEANNAPSRNNRFMKCICVVVLLQDKKKRGASYGSLPRFNDAQFWQSVTLLQRCDNYLKTYYSRQDSCWTIISFG